MSGGDWFDCDCVRHHALFGFSALYEQGRVHHVGPFPRLEDQMCAFTVDFDRREMGYSPDRVDALVWALTELMIDSGERRLLIA